MRNLEELKLRCPYPRPVPRACSASDVAWFEGRYGVKLPAAYAALLMFCNGGHTRLDRFLPAGSRDGEVFAIDHFYYLMQDPPDPRGGTGGSLWRQTEVSRPYLGPRAVPVAEDGFGNQVYLDFSSDPPPVRLSVHDAAEDLLVAADFEKFLDLLRP
jgi:hypothetical protein